jgi:hypothetical protein
MMKWIAPTTWAAWLIDNVPLGPFAPWVFGFIVGRRPRRVRK